MRNGAPLPVELEDDRLLAQAPHHLPQPLVDHRLLAHTQLFTNCGQAVPLNQGVERQYIPPLRRLSYCLFQQLSILLQPDLCLFHRRRLCTNNVPKFGRMVGLDEVCEFMDNDVIDDKHRRFYKPPVEI